MEVCGVLGDAWSVVWVSRGGESWIGKLRGGIGKGLLFLWVLLLLSFFSFLNGEVVR